MFSLTPKREVSLARPGGFDLLGLNINSLMQFRRTVRLHIAFGDYVRGNEHLFAVAQPHRSGVSRAAHLNR